MTNNPIVNALAGLLYIVVVASFLFYVPPFIRIENTVLIPIAILSLFVFSAACMSYIFLYEPLKLLIEGQKKESINLFLKTLGAFAISAAVLVSIGLFLVP